MSSRADIRHLVPDQSGRIAFVTGGTAGLGLELSSALASAGATVLIGGRDEEKGADAVARIRSESPGASVEFIETDLMDLTGVAEVAASVSERGRLDLLVNNAGVMAPPLSFSTDGYESQWATNVIGPFALTAGLLPVLTRTAGSRVVTVTSIAHLLSPLSVMRARLDGQGVGYIPFLVYGRTKLADLLVSRELQRRFSAAGSSSLSVAAHPGVSGTGIAADPLEGASAGVQRAVVSAWSAVTRSPELAMQPILAAATAPLVRGGDLIGPRAAFQTLGRPARVASSPRAHDGQLARDIVGYLESVTGLPLAV